MKNVLKTMMLLALVALIAAPVGAAEEKKKKKGNKGNFDPAAALVKRVKAAGVEGDTLAKVEALAKEYGPKITEARKGLGDAAKKINEARKAAAADGKKGKELQEAVKAVQLTDEQQAAQKAVQGLQRKYTAAVAALLSPEQLKAAKIRAPKNAGADKKKKKKKKAE